MGSRFGVIPGAGETIFHIGGTSYLARTADDVSHWDYWPLNVHYFNLRLLSLPKCTAFRERFRSLYEWYGSPEALLDRYPDYRKGWRFAEVGRIFEKLECERVYT